MDYDDINEFSRIDPKKKKMIAPMRVPDEDIIIEAMRWKDEIPLKQEGGIWVRTRP